MQCGSELSDNNDQPQVWDSESVVSEELEGEALEERQAVVTNYPWWFSRRQQLRYFIASGIDTSDKDRIAELDRELQNNQNRLPGE